jgi:hypothetical protein
VIRRSTVFVVGAGASADYGLPLGPALVRLIVDGLGETGVLRQSLLEAEFALGDLETFADRLTRSDLTSIDAFLEGNVAQFTEIGKAVIASAILFCEQNPRERLFKESPNDHWLRYLWNGMKSETDAENFSRNRVSFVTFNYDRLIEYYFDTVLEHTFNLGRDDALKLRKDSMRIVHLHGCIAGRDFGVYTHPLAGDVVKHISRGIRVVHDQIPQGDPVFEMAYDLLREAERVCFLGFGYHPVNLTRLQLQSLDYNRTQLLGTAYGLGGAEVEMAKTRVGRSFTTGARNEKIEEFLREHVLMQ